MWQTRYPDNTTTHLLNRLLLLCCGEAQLAALGAAHCNAVLLAVAAAEAEHDDGLQGGVLQVADDLEGGKAGGRGCGVEILEKGMTV